MENRLRIGETEKNPELILASIRAHPGSHAIQANGITALSALVRDVPSTRECVAGLSGIPLVLDLLSKYPDNSKVQTAGIAFLANMALSKDNHREIVDHGGVDTILRSMGNNRDSPQLLSLCCTAMCNLTKDNLATKSLVVEKGVLEHVLTTLKSHSQDAGVQQSGFSLLRNLASLDENIQIKISKLDGVTIINSGLATHRSNKGVTLQGISALLNMSFSNEALRNEIVQKCTVGISLAIKSHEDDHEIVSNSLSLITNLTSCDQNRRKIRDHEGIPIVMETLSRLPSRPDALENCCHALCNLALLPENRLDICQTNGPRLLNETMLRFPHNADLQKAVISAHKNLVSEETQPLICDESPRSVDGIVTAMTGHPENKKLQTEACAALCNFAVDERLAEYMATATSAKCIILAMIGYPSCVELQTSACMALGNLVLRCPANLSVIVDNGGMEAMLSAMATHSSSAGVQEGCFCVLSAVARDVQIELPRQEQETTLDLVLSALRHHPCSDIINMSGLYVIAALIQKSNNNLEYIVSRDALKVVSNAIGRLPAGSGMEDVAEWIMETLSDAES